MSHRVPWSVVGYLILCAGVALALFLIRQESLARQAFDDRRAYELCLTGNDARMAIADAIRGSGEDLIAVSRASQVGRVPPLTAEEKAHNAKFEDQYRDRIEARVAPLKPRKCEILPQNSAGPQR